MRSQSRYPLVNRLHLRTLPLKAGHLALLGILVREDKFEESKRLLRVDVTEKGFVVLKRGSSGGGRRGGRRSVEVELGVVILLLDLDERRLLGLDRALDDGEVRLDLLNG